MIPSVRLFAPAVSTAVIFAALAVPAIPASSSVTNTRVANNTVATSAAFPGTQTASKKKKKRAKKSAARPTVTVGISSAVVTWKGAGKKFRVLLKTRTGPWRTVATTTTRRHQIDGLNPLVRYRAAVSAKRPKQPWKRLGKPSVKFRPLAPSPVTPPPNNGGGGGGGGAAPPATPPANATVIWVNPSSGNDGATGSEATPVRTVTEAWNRIPRATALSQPYWMQLTPGTYATSTTPNYWEERYGTADAPIVLNATAGAHTVTFAADINAFDVRHLQVVGVDIIRNGDAFHCEKCSNVHLLNMTIEGGSGAHETIKVNQSDHITISNSDISGGEDNTIDFVAVQYATVSGNRIHGAQDWCMYVKGGSAYVDVTGNEIFDCGTGGFTAGQGTGFEFMTSPWLRYEAYGITVTDNIIHDTEGAGLGVNGGYNIVMAFNTLYRVGTRSHTVEFVHGSRGCDGNFAQCQANHDQGGWGGASVDGQWIPSKHIAFVNNIIFNPVGVESRWQHLEVQGPATAPAGSNVPNPSLADEDLVIAGNVFRNGGLGMPTGLSHGEGAFLAANRVNTITPDLVNPAAGDFRPISGGTIAGLPSVTIPIHGWSDSGPGVPAMATPQITTDRPPGALRP